MKINANINTNANAINNNFSKNLNFKGAIKLTPNDDSRVCLTLLKKIEPIFWNNPENRSVLKTQKGINCINLNFFEEQRIEQYVINNLIKVLNIKNYIYWNKKNISKSEFAKFSNLEIPPHEISKQTRILGAYKINFEEADKLQKGILIRHPKSDFETLHNNDKIILKLLANSKKNKQEANIPIIESKFNKFIKGFFNPSTLQSPNYIICNIPLTAEEFSVFANSKVYS